MRLCLWPLAAARIAARSLPMTAANVALRSRRPRPQASRILLRGPLSLSAIGRAIAVHSSIPAIPASRCIIERVFGLRGTMHHLAWSTDVPYQNVQSG
uniref:Putative secreted protein n=1 Tax=Anopheles darlingi TaxID=43151 RepID=A0A2M4D2E7_ANODA